jgi:hypothetical protein
MITYCEYCDKVIDLDYDSEHFSKSGDCYKRYEGLAIKIIQEIELDLVLYGTSIRNTKTGERIDPRDVSIIRADEYEGWQKNQSKQ